jgi:2-C-methyl-D-erythritol 2,4-cyclodiphosphate synthase
VKIRIGLGFDIHRLEAGRPLVLGGVRIPHSSGLAGHSDADALFHAMSDALLGAARLGNVGTRFPDTDPRYKDADSGLLLAEVSRLVREAGLSIGNIDCNILAEEPRLQGYCASMEANSAEALGVGPDQVSVKARTFEKLGPIGRGEAIAAEAVALVYAP